MKAYRVETLADTKMVYTVVQMRTDGNNIKLQAVGPKRNREYGLSASFGKDACPELYDFLKEVETADKVNDPKDLYEE